MLVMVALAPVFALALYTAVDSRREGAAQVQRDALRLADEVSRDHREAVAAARHLLESLARIPAVRDLAPACSAVLTEVLGQSHLYGHVSGVTPGGDIACSTAPRAGRVNLADRPYFRRALERRAFTAGDVVVGKITGQPVFTLTYPVVDARGSIRSVLVVALDVRTFLAQVATAQLPAESNLLMIDGTGAILAAHPDVSPPGAAPVRDAAIVATVLERRRGVAEARGPDGRRRLWGFSPLDDPTDGAGMYVAVGIPHDVVFAQTNDVLRREIVALVVITGLALGVAWITADVLLLRSLRALEQVARRLGAGESASRVLIPHAPRELGQLAGTFNEMAEALETRQAELQAARNAADREHRRLYAVLDDLPAAVFLVGPDHSVRFTNKFFRSRWGAPGRRACHEILYGRSSPCETCPYLQLLETRCPQTWESTLADGSAYQMHAYPFVDVDGAPLALKIAIDITERRRAEEALRKSSALLRAAIASAPLAVYVIDAAGIVRLWNRAAEAMFGWTEGEVLGRRLPIVPAGAEAEFEEIRVRLFDGEAIVGMGLKREAKDGRQIDVFTSAAPVRDASERVPLAVVFVADVTDRKTLEQQVRQLQKLEAVGRLAGGIAHDFNNLITVITGRADLLLRRLPEHDRTRRDIEIIRATAGRTARLTRQLLAFSRKQVLEPKVVDLNALTNDMASMLRQLIGEDIEFVLAHGEALGCVKADPGQVEQVIANLAVNARDAMPDGGRLTIETSNVELDRTYTSRHAEIEPGAYVMLAVTDTGVGMDPETRARVFEPFFTTKEPGKGTGLGLSTVYGIVKQSGGHIAVYSERGYGTTFKIYFPRVDEAPAVEEDRAPAPRRQATETVLLVEDEVEVLAMTREILGAEGYTILAAHDPEEAELIAARHAGPIHLMVTDVVMPKLSGPRLAARLAMHRPETRVLYTSGYTENGIIHDNVLDPGTAFIEKPFTPPALADKVRAVLDA